LLTALPQRAQAFVAPNEEAGGRVKKTLKHEETPNSEAMEMVKKIKAAKAPLAAAVLGGGLSSGDASRYFSFGHAPEEGAEKKHKKSKREGKDEGSGGDVERKKKAKE
jgi:hypothetical protein